MKIGEVKLRISNTAMELIDVYFNDNTLNEKFINSTLHVVVKQKSYMFMLI